MVVVHGVCLFYKENFEIIRYDDIEQILKPFIFAKIIITKEKHFNIEIQYNILTVKMIQTKI